MIDTPWITRTTGQIVALIHLRIPRDQIGSVIGPALGELYGAIKAQGLQPAGPWFTHHLVMSPSEFDFEVCVPVPTPVTATGRVSSAVLPAVKVARTIHRGPYDGAGGLAAAWREFSQWIAANGHAEGPDLYERYLAGPDSTADAARWRTELSRVLREKE